jgi:hypothetical protein
LLSQRLRLFGLLHVAHCAHADQRAGQSCSGPGDAA